MLYIFTWINKDVARDEAAERQQFKAPRQKASENSDLRPANWNLVKSIIMLKGEQSYKKSGRALDEKKV
ncbi:hypothetical protein DNH61_11890 [Paenibacillus sambharensis]|uniref:Uncharacterized protein n=1 Tax=Paenibacillus sambharensis TaxID=1803190 RepID=A0A2W1LL81_9BACL|nr:hypothetical protein DNH61_11890 [Paenibacillus sambharensis]